jgi:predicted dinucleotide-binding enzyme
MEGTRAVQISVLHQLAHRYIAGDNDAAKQKVYALASDIGYAPIDTGPLYTARYLESMAHLNIQIAVGQGGGTHAAFIYR